MLATTGPADGNSLLTIVWHVAGNLRSRFTAFLTEDGEKVWRDREDEFAPRPVSRDELMVQWRSGWTVLYEAIGPLTNSELHRVVTIRGQAMCVHDALHRSLAHVSYHVGQIVYLVRAQCGTSWTYLSIPPGVLLHTTPRQRTRHLGSKSHG